MDMDKIITGYTTGVFDLFHIGHLNIIKQAKSMCDQLIVGVSTDELAYILKGKKPIIPFNERLEIIESIRYVDFVVPEIINDKISAWEKYQFDLIFKGDDWKNTERWMLLEKQFEVVGVKIFYFQYTKNTSSSIIREVLKASLHNSKIGSESFD
jgi:glycerol-3-phosphate cytidylyltransferase